MENLAPSSGLSPLLRPVTALQGDLAAALREGRVLAGQVLEKLDGGTYVLSVAGQRVAAESRVELEVGSSQRFEVVRQGTEVLLRLVMPATTASEPPLLAALRVLSGAELPAEETLAALEDLLARGQQAGASESPRSARILAVLAQRLYELSSGAEGLRAQIERTAPGGAAALLAAFAELGIDAPERAIASFGAVLAGALERALQRAGRSTGELGPGMLAAQIERALSEALAHLAAPELRDSLGQEPIRLLAGALHAALVRVLRARAGRSHADLVAGGVLEALGPHVLLEGGELPLLRLLFHAHGGPTGTAFARSLRALALAGAEHDLEGLLAAALPELGAGELADATRGALRSLELEHILQLARHASGDPAHACFSVPDAGSRAQVHVLLEHERNEGGASAEPDDVWRTSVSVDLASLGPVRADVLLRSGTLAIRLTAERAETVARLRAATAALEASLIGLRPELSIGVVPARDPASANAPSERDIRFLREHHLLDLRG